MPSLEIRISSEVANAGLLGLLAAFDFFPSGPPEEIILLEEEDADAWGQPAIRAALTAAITSCPSMRVLKTGHLPVSNLQGLMDFYAAVGKPLDFIGPPPKLEPERFFPLTWVAEDSEVNGTSDEVARVLTDDPEARRYLVHFVAELLENALHHGRWNRGALVGAQLFPASERAQVAIVDCGQGIRQHLSQNPALHIASDAEALDQALRPWVTGTAGQSHLDRAVHGHVGCGLPMTAGLVGAAGGVMFLCSSAAAVRIETGGRHFAAIRPWRGTVVVIDVTRSRLRGFPQVSGRVREGFGPRPTQRCLRFG